MSPTLTPAGPHQFAPVAEREFRRAAHAGEVILELPKRGGQDMLRPIDPKGRALPVAFPAKAGPLTLDFNYTQNLQRPYTAFAPCPLSPAQNTVAVAVEAGEQLPVFSR